MPAKKDIIVSQSSGRCEVCHNDDNSVSIRVMGETSAWLIFCGRHAEILTEKLIEATRTL
jgi:hypothetical protein